MAERRYYPVPEGLAGQRVDAVLARMTGMSRAACAKVVETGGVWIDGRLASKSDRAQQDSVVEILVPEPAVVEPRPSPAGLPRLFEDGDIVVVDKPQGMAAHPSLNFDGPDVLGTLLAEGTRLTTSGPPERKGIVHRLDVGTSGCMVVAKSELAYTLLKRAFRDRTVNKAYHALVQGHPDPTAGTIDAPIGRYFRHRWKMGVREDGRNAVTGYETLEAMPSASLLNVRLLTGRTHQIRVHMSAVGHPCVGDAVYGADPVLAERLGLDRQWLHAVRLGFEHPASGEWVEFFSDYPEDLARSLEGMRERVRG